MIIKSVFLVFLVFSLLYSKKSYTKQKFHELETAQPDKTRKKQTKAQCLASYFGYPGKFSTSFFVVFQASPGKKLQKKSWKKITKTRNLRLNILLKSMILIHKKDQCMTFLEGHCYPQKVFCQMNSTDFSCKFRIASKG